MLTNCNYSFYTDSGGNNKREFIWFLSRTPEIEPELLEKMREIALAQGYDLTDLFFVPQKERE